MGQKLVSRATYWRRRVVVLLAGVMMVGLPIWAVNKALGGSQAQGSPQAYAGHVTGPSPRAGRGHRQPSAREGADPSSPPQARPSVSPRGGSIPPARGTGRQTCPRGDVRLTLRSAQQRYGSGQLVTFVIGAVATRSRPCRIDLGPRFTSVVVAADGTPLWDSSSCLRGTGSRLAVLSRGTPAYLQVTWDRRTSMSGCPGQGSAVRAGTYTVAAFHGQLHSQAVTFVLSGQGAARP